MFYACRTVGAESPLPQILRDQLTLFEPGLWVDYAPMTPPVFLDFPTALACLYHGNFSAHKTPHKKDSQMWYSMQVEIKVELVLLFCLLI